MPQKHSVVMLMLIVLTPKDRTTALVNLVIRETEKHVKVKFVVVQAAETYIIICASKYIFEWNLLGNNHLNDFLQL